MSAKVPTANQRAALASLADKLKCPRCLRRHALSSRYELRGPDGVKRIGSARQCRYCGHVVGIRDGEPFGRDVTPEPGVRALPRLAVRRAR